MKISKILVVAMFATLPLTLPADIVKEAEKFLKEKAANIIGTGKRINRPIDKEDIDNGLYKLSLKSGWDRNEHGVHFVVKNVNGKDVINVGITQRLCNELKQSLDFKDMVFSAFELRNDCILQIPAHNLDGIEIKEYKKVIYHSQDGSTWTSLQAYTLCTLPRLNALVSS